MSPHDPRPAHRQDAGEIAAIFGEVKAADHDVEIGGRQVLAAARRAGKALLRAKERVRHGEWLKTLNQFLPGKSRTARCYMQIAQNWERVKAAASIHEALSWLAHATQDAEEKQAPGKPNVQRSALFSQGRDEEQQDGAASDGLDAASPQTPEGPEATCTEPSPPEPLPDRSAEYIARVQRMLIQVRELLSEAYDAGGRAALEHAAVGRPSLLGLNHDGGIVRHGTSAEGIEFGPKRVSNEALDALIRMVGAAKLYLSTGDQT